MTTSLADRWFLFDRRKLCRARFLVFFFAFFPFFFFFQLSGFCSDFSRPGCPFLPSSFALYKDAVVARLQFEFWLFGCSSFRHADAEDEERARQVSIINRALLIYCESVLAGTLGGVIRGSGILLHDKGQAPRSCCGGKFLCTLSSNVQLSAATG